MRYPLAAVIGGLMTLLCASTAVAEGTNLTGQRAPEISASDGFSGWSAGQGLSALRGSPVAIKFLFAACPACRNSMPEFESLYRAYGPRGVKFVCVAYDDRGAMESWWRRAGFTVPVALDPSGATSSRYGVRSYPTTYLVGADGNVVSYQRIDSGTLELALSQAAPRATARVAPAEPTPAKPVTTARAAAAAPVHAGASGSSSDAIDPRSTRNLEELGPLPEALADVREAARRNDYGEVLRLSETHLDPSKDTPEVVLAAGRARAVALKRHDVRMGRIESRWQTDSRGAYLALLAMAKDFHDTTAERALIERAHRVYAALTIR